MTAERAPDWATKEADKLLGIGWGNQNQGIRATLSDDIARALVAAERRGLERAAKLADRRADMASQVSHSAAIALLQALPAAIRKLMESSDEA